jgi:hypothetical protein
MIVVPLEYSHKTFPGESSLSNFFFVDECGSNKVETAYKLEENDNDDECGQNQFLLKNCYNRLQTHMLTKELWMQVKNFMSKT